MSVNLSPHRSPVITSPIHNPGAIAKFVFGHFSFEVCWGVGVGLRDPRVQRVKYDASGSSHLACGHELKRAERNLEVRCVRLEVVESSRDAGLELGWALARWARGRDLVEGAHVCGGCRWEWESKSLEAEDILCASCLGASAH